MSVGLATTRRRSQPRGPAQIDWGNPITRGLVFFTCNDHRVDLVKGRRATLVGTQVGLRASKGGTSPAFAENLSLAFDRDAALEPPQVTLWSHGRRGLSAAANTFQLDIWKTYNNYTSPQYGSYGLFSESSQARVWKGNNSRIGNTDPDMFSGKIYTQAGLVSATVQQAYLNGKPWGSQTATSAIPYDSTATGKLIISGNGANGMKLKRDLYAAAIWSRLLTTAEIQSLHDNPWQLLRPVRSYFYFSDSTPIDIAATLESISLSTFAASISADRDISAGQESIALQTFGANVQANIDMNIAGALESISLVALQSDVQANIDSDIAGAQENIALITNAATVRANVDSDISAGLASIAVSAFQAGIAIGLNVASEQITLSTFLAAVTADRPIVGSLESISLSTNIAAVRLGTSISAGAESITLQTNAAAVALDIAISAQLQSIVITELAAQIKLSTNLDAVLQSLTVTPYGATLTLGSGISANLETLTLATFGAVISASLPPIESPGLEYTVIGGRLHYTLPVSKLHFTFGS